MRRQKGFLPALAAALLIISMLPWGIFGAGAEDTSGIFSAQYKNSIYKEELAERTLTGNPVSDIVSVALSQVYYHEGNSVQELGGFNAAGDAGYTEYGWWLGTVALSGSSPFVGEWSGAFISWCARQASVRMSVLPTYTDSRALSTQISFVPAASAPAVGDIVYFTDGAEMSAHTGLVFSVTPYEIMTVEGDVNGAVAIREYFIDDETILGYGRPSYGTGGLYAASTAFSGTTLTVEELRKKFPAGKFWNGGNPDKVTSTPCTHHKTTGCSYYGGCFCNVFYNSISNCIQCQGFSMKMGYDAYGINPYLWQQDTDPDALYRLKPGDIIRYKNNGHTIFVLGVKDNIITYADCNNDYQCIIRWDATVTIEKVKSTFSYVRVAPYALNSNGLAVQFNANGGTVPGSDKQTVYTCVYAGGLNIRSGAGVSYSKVGEVPKNGRFVVTATASANGYTWGKINYNGVTGWVVISVSLWVTKSTSRISDYYVGPTGTVYSSADSALVFQSLKYGTKYTSGLMSAADFGIVRSGYKFLGWSLTQTGDNVITAGTSITADKIQPASSTGGQTVVVYAVWQPMSPETGVITASVKNPIVGDTVKFTISSANATKYDFTVMLGNKVVYSVGGTTAKTASYKFTEPGTYVISGASYNEYGGTAAQAIKLTVTAPKINLIFNPNGGIIGDDDTMKVYTVSAEAGLKLRAAAGTTSAAKTLAVMPQGATFRGDPSSVVDTGSYLWIKAIYNGIEGWTAFYNKAENRYNAVSGYCIDDNTLCDPLTGKAYTLTLTYNEKYEAGLPDLSEFGVVREGYRFVGWSIGSQSGVTVAPNTPVTLTMTGVSTVVAYAVWEPDTQIGDINGDGVINSKDLLALRNHVANISYSGESGNDDGQPSADVNRDGKVDSKDLIILRRYIALYDYATGASGIQLG